MDHNNNKNKIKIVHMMSTSSWWWCRLLLLVNDSQLRSRLFLHMPQLLSYCCWLRNTTIKPNKAAFISKYDDDTFYFFLFLYYYSSSCLLLLCSCQFITARHRDHMWYVSASCHHRMCLCVRSSATALELTAITLFINTFKRLHKKHPQNKRVCHYPRFKYGEIPNFHHLEDIINR